MKINRLIVAICVIVIIFGGIFLSQALGLWQTKNSGGGRGSSGEHEDEVEHIDEKAEESQDSEYDDEEEHKEGEVVGSSTVRDVLDMGISSEDIVRLVGEYDSEDILIKDLSTQNGLSFGKVKTALNELIK